MKIAALAIGVLAVVRLIRWAPVRRKAKAAAARVRRTYRPGEVWTYRTRAGETASRLTILKINRLHNKTIVHVRVSGVAIPNVNSPTGTSTFISHMPFTEEAIDESVMKLVKRVDRLPPFEEGFDRWVQEAALGKAGVFTIGVADAIDGIESGFRRSAKPQLGNRWSGQDE